MLIVLSICAFGVGAWSGFSAGGNQISLAMSEPRRCALMVTPYLYAYDLVALAIPAAFLVRDMTVTGILRGERAVLIALYFGSVTLIRFWSGCRSRHSRSAR